MYLMNRFPHKRNTNVKVGDTIYRIGPGGFICSDNEQEPLDVPDVDAAKLIQGRAWSELDWDPSDPENARRFAAAADYPKGKGLGRPPRTMEQMKADYGLTDDKAGIKPLNRADLPPQAIGGAVSKDGTLSGVEKVAPSDESIAKAAGDDQKSEESFIAEQRKRGEEAPQLHTAGDAAVGDGRDATRPSMESAVIAAEQRKQADTPPAPEANEVAYPTIPKGDQEWPDPAPDMKLSYLKKMADAYGINYRANIGAKTLSERVYRAMYSDD